MILLVKKLSLFLLDVLMVYDGILEEWMINY